MSDIHLKSLAAQTSNMLLRIMVNLLLQSGGERPDPNYA